MANQLYQQLQKTTASQNPLMNDNFVGMIKNMASMLQGSQNPVQILQMLSNQNSQFAQMLNLINSSGSSPKELFMTYAQKMGISPEQILNVFK